MATPSLRVQAKVSLGVGADLRVVGDVSVAMLGDDVLSRRVNIAAGASFTITAPIGAFCLLASAPVTVQLSTALPVAQYNTTTLEVAQILYHTTETSEIVITAGSVAAVVALNYLTRQTLTLAPPTKPQLPGTVPVNGLTLTNNPVTVTRQSVIVYSEYYDNGATSDTIVSDTPPPSPTVGMEWFDTTSGIEYTYIFDGDTYQWVASY